MHDNKKEKISKKKNSNSGKGILCAENKIQDSKDIMHTTYKAIYRIVSTI